MTPGQKGAGNRIVATAKWTSSIRRLFARRVVLVIACMGAASGLPTLDVVARQGGKAEPLRIQFQPGRDSATVNDTLSGDVQSEYAFRARKGQRVTIAATAVPAGSIVVTIRNPEGGELPLLPDSDDRMSAVLPSDGDYAMWVRRRAAAPGRSTYKLTLTIRAPAAKDGAARRR
jgi:hypothetical protein